MSSRSHQRLAASVHSAARPQSPSAWQESIVDAVDDSRRERIQLAADCRCGRLVEEREAGVDRAAHDERRALEHERHRLEAPVAVLRAELARTGEPRLGGVELAQIECGEPACEREVPVCGRLRPALEEALAPAEPAGGDGRCSLDHVVHRERDPEHGRAVRLVCVDEGRVGTLAQPERLLEVAGPPGGLGHLLEVVRVELPAFVHLAQQPVRVSPRVRSGRFPAGFEWVAGDLGHWRQCTPQAAHQPRPFG